MIIDIVNIDFEMIANHSESLFSKLFNFFLYCQEFWTIKKLNLFWKYKIFSGQCRTVLLLFLGSQKLDWDGGLAETKEFSWESTFMCLNQKLKLINSRWCKIIQMILKIMRVADKLMSILVDNYNRIESFVPVFVNL